MTAATASPGACLPTHRWLPHPKVDDVPRPRPNNILEWHFVICGPSASPYEGGHYHGKLIFPPEYPYKPPSIIMLTPKCGRCCARPICSARPQASGHTVAPVSPVARSHSLAATVASVPPRRMPCTALTRQCPASRARADRMPRETPVHHHDRHSAASPRSGRFQTNTRLCLSMSDFHPETWVPAWSVASILNGVMSFMLEATPTVRPRALRAHPLSLSLARALSLSPPRALFNLRALHSSVAAPRN